MVSDVRGDNFVILRDEARAGTQVLHELAAFSRVHMQAYSPSRNAKDPDPPRGARRAADASHQKKQRKDVWACPIWANVFTVLA